MDRRVFRLRVTYLKSGRLAMLSHLELTHALERIVRRANLPFALSQGFSPHMKIAFGSALPVGIGGKQEIFDVLLDDYVSAARALEALQDAAPDDLMPQESRYIEPKAPAASVAYPYSYYEAVVDSPIDVLRHPKHIEVIRKKKAKTLNVDDYLVGVPTLVKGPGDGDASSCAIRFQLKSSNSGSLRPDVFVSNCLAASCLLDEAISGDIDIIQDDMMDKDKRVPRVVSFMRLAQSESPIDELL